MTVEISALREYIEANYGKPQRVYLDLYIKKVKLLVYSKEFDQHILNQIPYIITKNDDAGRNTRGSLCDRDGYFDNYCTCEGCNEKEDGDVTIVLWKEKDVLAPDIISEYDPATSTYYYGVKNPEYEEFIKQGHFLVNIFYKILKTEHSSLVHGAAVGMNGEGVLLCARGQRGKSTLTVLSIFMGMEYVSDDYLLLETGENDRLYASPIYSIITLSPFMAKKLEEPLRSAVKLGKNARKDKYVYNISSMHESFRKHYPIRALMFPEILDTPKPFIREATRLEKVRAVTQLIHSTMLQMNDMKDPEATRKLMHMVEQYNCYYIGLSPDIEKNSKLLKDFCAKWDS